MWQFKSTQMVLTVKLDIGPTYQHTCLSQTFFFSVGHSVEQLGCEGGCREVALGPHAALPVPARWPAHTSSSGKQQVATASNSSMHQASIHEVPRAHEQYIHGELGSRRRSDNDVGHNASGEERV